MATIDLGKLGFVNKGTYSSSTSYEKNDLVQYTDSGILSTYLYINASAATGQTPSTSGTVNGTYWAYYAKGAAAYSSTLTTQGDILYHNGSGEARLAAGTSGQVLQTGGSGANPSWTTLTSDYVKIAQTNITSSTASVDFIDGTGGVVLDSTYRIYKLIGSYRGTSNGAEFQIRVINGGSNTRSSGYLNETFRSYYSGGTSRANATDKILRSQGGVQASAGQRANFEATFFNMSDSDHNTTAHCQYCAIDGSGETEDQVNNGISSGCYATPEAHNGINFSLSSGSVGEAEFTLIGIKG